MHIYIDRWYQHDATIGRLVYGDFQCFSLERVKGLNRINKDCILPGEYQGFKRVSPANGPCIQFEDKNGRTFIQIHKGNYVGDTVGCILVGDSIGLREDNTPWVKNSVRTLERLLDLVPDTVGITII